MASTSFQAIESSLSGAVVSAFENIRLSAGASHFGAVLDRAVDMMGEYGLTAEPRDRIRLLRADAVAAGFVSGMAVAADPTEYTPAEILAMPRSAWKLDRLAEDDGHIVGWWLK